MPLVYISSTYEDLRDHRLGVFDAVRRVDHEPIGMEHYQASEQRPLDRCLDDVRRCHGYIGVLGWRHGFVPRGHTKSITRLEYEEAGRQGIPRMIFLCPDDNWPGTLRDANPGPVAEFRALARGDHVVDVFESVADLKYKVGTALVRQLGPGVVVPALLPYRCDRHDQYADIADAVAQAAGPGPAENARRPVVLLVHGREVQAVNKFVQCVREDAVTLLGGAGGEGCLWKEVQWPTEGALAAFGASAVRNVARALGRMDLRSADGVAACIDELAIPLILHTRVYVDEWSPERELGLRSFVAFWNEMPLPPRGSPLVVLLTVEYREGGGWFTRGRVERRRRDVRASLERVTRAHGPGVALVRELPDVRRFDAETWADGDQVQAILAGGDVRTEIATVFAARDAMPMRPLADELLAILQRKAS